MSGPAPRDRFDARLARDEPPDVERLTLMTSSTDPTIRWLLEGDPAIRWQTLRDLRGAGEADIERERGRVAREGWGARLLAEQGTDGRWAGGASPDVGLYSPKWTSTTYTLLLLRDLGLDPSNQQAAAGCRLLLDRGLRRDGGVNFGVRARRIERGETCVTGMVLSILSYFRTDDARLDTMADRLLAEQMDDGGWNCRRPAGATHGSVHTTISALEGLWHYERHRGGKLSALCTAQRRGLEFLLVHRLFRSHRTGRLIASELTRFSFPPRWHYDILRALDFFRAVHAPHDDRLTEAIAIVCERRGRDGRWALQHVHRGKTYFDMEAPGEPSRWNTLRAMRVLKWWGGATLDPSHALGRE